MLTFSVKLSLIFIDVSRNWKYEQELASLLWKIDLKDVTMIKVASISYTGGSSYLSKVSCFACGRVQLECIIAFNFTF